ncbi:MAG: hypothetical protein NTX00_05760 [Candidatus Parcubacteria bacterium]|nr:hypothetical protein [Candidatus Parcubacteria bacterium]
MREEKMRFLIELDGSWKVVIMPKEEAKNWIYGNPKAILLRYMAATKTSNIPCETKEEALEIVAQSGGRVQVIQPEHKIYDNLPEQAIELLYQS